MNGQQLAIVEPQASSLPVTRHDVDTLKKQRELLKEFVQTQLREGIDNDYAVIPGTKKKSLLKPGAEKLQRLFGLRYTLELVDKEIDRGANFAMYTYRAKVFHIATGNMIAECEACVNSQEKKYKTRTVWKQTQNGRMAIDEETPIFDILNTIMKMAQKRAVVGATIAAVGASDFFSQDIDDEIDAQQVGLKATVEKPAPEAAQEPTKAVPQCCGSDMFISKFVDKAFGHKPYYCVKCKNKVAAQ